MMSIRALSRPVVRAATQAPRRGFAGHAHAEVVAKPGDYFKPSVAVPSDVAFFGSAIGNALAKVKSNSTFASFSSRTYIPWMASVPLTLWFVTSMGMDREAYEKSENPGYSESMELKYKAQDKKLFFQGQKVKHDAEFEVYAAKMAEEFSGLSPEDKSKLQEKYAKALVEKRVAQAKGAATSWLCMNQKEYDLKQRGTFFLT